MEPTWAGVFFMALITIGALAGIAKMLLACEAELQARKMEYESDYEGKYVF